MSACGSYFQGSFDIALTFDIGEIDIRVGLIEEKLFAGIEKNLFKGSSAIEKICNLFEIIGSQHFQVLDNSSFFGIFSGKDNSFELFFSSLYGDGENASDWS